MATAQTAHIPPQNLEAEESVLGAMMVSEGSITPVILDVRLHADDFYRDRHRTIYEAIRALYERSEPIDALTVAEFLTQRGDLDDAGGKDNLQTLASTVPAPGNARHYAQIVKQNALLRRLLGAAQTIQQSVHERDGEQLAQGDGDLTGVPSGFDDLDKVSGGFQPGNLIVIAARPAMGKSALVTNIAQHVSSGAKETRPVAFFSLEMSEAELAHRFIAIQARISSDRLRRGRVSEKDWPGVVQACNVLEKAPLWIDDSSDLSMLDLRAKARRLTAAEGELGVIIIDYIQLMRPEDPRQNRVEQVGQISRGLKILARELNVPVIALSQLSRAPEQRPDKRPILSDLRESGNIEQDADLVAFLYRDEYYDPESEAQGEAELIIRKHRNGPIDMIRLAFRPHYPSFASMRRQERPVEQRPGEGPPLDTMDAVEEL
jgi:replicative DNA helicase